VDLHHALGHDRVERPVSVIQQCLFAYRTSARLLTQIGQYPQDDAEAVMLLSATDQGLI
jgi:hypothetical protein